MRILAIETSCDETAIAVLEARSTKHEARKVDFRILSNQVLSQIKIHRPYGGVVPNLAMREHRKNLPIILKSVLKEAGENNPSVRLSSSTKNKIDAIAITRGPGLEPALWEGINFAKDLAKKWRVPLVGVNHLEGHIYAGWLAPTGNPKSKIRNPKEDNLSPSPLPLGEGERGWGVPSFPLLALIVSGGHTELVLMKKHLDYKILGETLDDAAGEAFDKVARMLGLDYPGGPAISRLAEKWKSEARNPKSEINFPRPMINSKDLNFSFSGLKTAVLYYLRDHPRANKAEVAREFQQAVVDVLCKKTADALKKYQPKSLVVGGGVAANVALRFALSNRIAKSFPNVSLHISPLWLCGDNAAMIAVAGYFRAKARKFSKPDSLKARGNLKLEEK